MDKSEQKIGKKQDKKEIDNLYAKGKGRNRRRQEDPKRGAREEENTRSQKINYHLERRDKGYGRGRTENNTVKGTQPKRRIDE